MLSTVRRSLGRSAVLTCHRHFHKSTRCKSTEKHQIGVRVLQFGTGVSIWSSSSDCFWGGKKEESNWEKFQRQVEETINSIQLPQSTEQVQTQINTLLASGAGGQISWGFMMGACSGFVSKKIGKIGAGVMGAVFMMMQGAAYTGYIQVNYKKMERDMTEFLDLNKDGKVDGEDAGVLYDKMMEVLQFSLPAGSGFVPGFILGFKRG